MMSYKDQAFFVSYFEEHYRPTLEQSFMQIFKFTYLVFEICNKCIFTYNQNKHSEHAATPRNT